MAAVATITASKQNCALFPCQGFFVNSSGVFRPFARGRVRLFVLPNLHGRFFSCIINRMVDTNGGA